MMEEEKYLIERVGRENPFRVPEGYFGTLTGSVMARIDAAAPAPRKARVLRLRPVAYAVAASLCALLISVAAYQYFGGTTSQTLAQQAELVVSGDDAFDAAADYIMVDNQDIYACLASDY